MSAIPLFSNVLLSVAAASAASIAVAGGLHLTNRRLVASPRALAWSIVQFAAVMVLFP
jgi:hypothetical protein